MYVRNDFEAHILTAEEKRDPKKMLGQRVVWLPCPGSFRRASKKHHCRITKKRYGYCEACLAWVGMVGQRRDLHRVVVPVAD